MEVKVGVLTGSVFVAVCTGVTKFCKFVIEIGSICVILALPSGVHADNNTTRINPEKKYRLLVRLKQKFQKDLNNGHPMHPKLFFISLKFTKIDYTAVYIIDLLLVKNPICLPSQINSKISSTVLNIPCQKNFFEYNPQYLGAWLSPDRVRGSGSRGRRFKSSRPDKKSLLLKRLFHFAGSRYCLSMNFSASFTIV